MFILDDILFSPIKGFLWLVNELHNAAQQDVEDERQRVMRELQSLHMKLETGRLSEEEFDELEQSLLDRLDVLDGMVQSGPEASEDDDEDDDEENEEP